MDNIKELFGKKVKELRIKNNLSQEELAEQIGIAERNLSKIECGKSFIRAEKLAKLSEILNVKLNNLFDFDYYKDLDKIREQLISDIKSDNENLRLLYRLYTVLKK